MIIAHSVWGASMVMIGEAFANHHSVERIQWPKREIPTVNIDEGE
jgi:hypothetical protein